MPPPPSSSCNKINTVSTEDQENVKNVENSKSDKQDFKLCLKSETISIVKSLLGPSLEDAVLRTLEFGKSLMQKQELDSEHIGRDSKSLNIYSKELTPYTNKELELLLEDRKQGALRGIKNDCDDRERLLSLQGHQLPRKANSSIRRLSNLSKIRSLDSDLKQSSPSPEKIKKQLEALIQINKDEIPENTWNIVTAKTPKIPVEMTVMPSLCVYKNEAEMNYSSSCDMHSQASRTMNDPCSNETSGRVRYAQKKRHPNKICQAPEFLSNALGPTIDVSIIDNLKMMRDIFKYDSGKGEGSLKEPVGHQMKQEIRLQNSEAEMTCRIEELQRKIEELEQKEQCLIKQIEEEEHERECRRRAFEQEEQRLKCLSEQMSCVTDTFGDGRGKGLGSVRSMECNFNTKLEALQSKVANEEEKLSRLKCQHDQYKRELAEVKCKAEALKKNKCLLDAWDIFASRVCHTRLPSFSRAYDLERKEFKSQEPVNMHCCFPPVTNQCDIKPSSAKSGSRCKSATKIDSKTDVCKETPGHVKCKMKMGEIQFPIQRDIFCGLHQMLKTCTCSSKAQLPSSEDELMKKKCPPAQACPSGCPPPPRAPCPRPCTAGCQPEVPPCKHHMCRAATSKEGILKDASGDKRACRSKSDTTLKNDKCSKIVKVMWAVTRINIFQNNYRTYEIMDATCTPPPCLPAKTEGIFVVKAPQKKCPEPPQKKCAAEYH